MHILCFQRRASYGEASTSSRSDLTGKERVRSASGVSTLCRRRSCLAVGCTTGLGAVSRHQAQRQAPTAPIAGTARGKGSDILGCK